MSDTAAFRAYRTSDGQTVELTAWTRTTDMLGVSLGKEDRALGSPKAGDMIVRDPANPANRWLVSADFVAAHLKAVS